jgi:uncharacterized MAPEG superfamily protein
MDQVNLLWAQIGAYHPALIALAILFLVVLIQSFLAGVLGLGKSGEVPGRPLKGSHEDFSFRVLRTYGNSVENLSVFAGTVFLAVIVGVKPSLVNWLAAIHLVFRLAYWGIYYSGIGKIIGGPRSITYVLGWFTNLILIISVLFSMV